MEPSEYSAPLRSQPGALFPLRSSLDPVSTEPFKVPTLNLEPCEYSARTRPGVLPLDPSLAATYPQGAPASHPFEITPATPTPPDVRIIVPLERIPQSTDFRAPQPLTRKKKIILVLGSILANLLLIGACTFTAARVFSPEAWWIGFILGLALSIGFDLWIYTTRLAVPH